MPTDLPDDRASTCWREFGANTEDSSRVISALTSMKDPTGNVQNFARNVFWGMSLLITTAAQAVEDDRLWLPSNFAEQFLDLKKAAESAEALERCQTVLQGTIDLEKSDKQRPIYRILCRQKNGASYNEMVDGLSFETLTTTSEQPEQMTPEELEAIRLEEERQLQEARENRIKSLWEVCHAAVKRKTAYMQEVKWLQELPPEPAEFTDTSVNFRVDIDAQSPSGDALKFVADCHFEESELKKMELSSRRETSQ